MPSLLPLPVQNLFKGNGDKVNPMQMAKINQSMAKMMDPRVLQQMGMLCIGWADQAPSGRRV